MIAHDRESCPICNGRDAKSRLGGFEGWNNPERFQQEIRILIHRLEELDAIALAIPDSFYRNRTLVFRVQQLVAQWRTATVAAQEADKELEKWQAENAKLKSELLKD